MTGFRCFGVRFQSACALDSFILNHGTIKANVPSVAINMNPAHVSSIKWCGPDAAPTAPATAIVAQNAGCAEPGPVNLAFQNLNASGNLSRRALWVGLGLPRPSSMVLSRRNFDYAKLDTVERSASTLRQSGSDTRRVCRHQECSAAWTLSLTYANATMVVGPTQAMWRFRV